MTTTIVTGRQLSLTIDSKVYDAQASSVTLTRENAQQEYQVFTGKAYKTTDVTATLAVTLYADWNTTPSICEAMWTAANSAPDTALSFTLVANTGATYTGYVFPKFPDVGGTAPDALSVSYTMTVKDGAVTQTLT